MLISTNHGKIYAGLLLTISSALACLLFTFFHKAAAPSAEISADQFSHQSRGLAVEDAAPSSRALRYEAAPSLSQRSANGEGGERSRQRGGRSRMTERELEEREQQEEMERELTEARERYDKPNEAARYWLSRRLPEGQTELPFELYLNAMEQLRQMPQYSTRERRELPSLREIDSEQRLKGEKASPSSLQAWTPLGPGNVGGRTRALVIHPRTPDTMFAGAASGGVWRTLDGGKSWSPLTDMMANLAVNALAIDPNNPDTVYAGTGEGFFNSDATRGAGIFRSFDGGNTWRRLDSTNAQDFYFVNDIVVSKINSNRLYAATRSGVMRSTDGGATWTRVVDEHQNNGCSDLAIRTDAATDIVFAACGLPANVNQPGTVQASIYRNDNASALGQWELVYSEEGMSRTSLAIAPSNQNVIYAVSSENGVAGAPHSLHAVFRSTGGGASGTWTKVNDGRSNKLNGALFTNPIWAFQSECRPGGANQIINQGWYDNVIAVDPQNENVVWAGGVDLFRSDDGGANWGMASFWQEDKTSARYAHADQHVIAFHPQFGLNGRQTMFVGNDGGIFRTDNARAQTVTGNQAPCSPNSGRIGWTSLNNGYAATQLYHGAPFPGGGTYFGGAQDNGVVIGSDDFGPNGWRDLLGGDGGYVAVDPTSPNILYAENNGLSLKKSTDGGKTWRAATTGINNTTFPFIVPFVMDPSDPTRLWLGGDRVYRTRNGADLWTAASAGLSGNCTAVAVAPADSTFVLAGTDQGYIHRSINANPSPDLGWPSARPRSSSQTSGATVSSLAFDPTNRDIAYATYSNFGGKHVWRSVNGGVNWQAIDGPPPIGPTPSPDALPDVPVNCIVIDPTNPQRLYVGTDIGVFTSPNAGQTWAVENSGFANVPVEWLSVGMYNGSAYLFAFTHGRGAWRVPLGQVCTYTIAPTSLAFDATGGTGSVSVTASSNDCSWKVENVPPWITITSPMTMQGSGVVSFNVAPAPSGRPRVATITIAGMSFMIPQAGVAACVSAASYQSNMLAPESLVTAWGDDLADGIQAAVGSTLPLKLLNTSIKVRDSGGNEFPAPLFFVSPSQINFLMPKAVGPGPAMVTIYNGTGKLYSCPVRIGLVAPGLFSANATGQGVILGQALHYSANSFVRSEPLDIFDGSINQVVARPIDLGPEGDQVFLVIYGTGFRFRSSLSAVKVTIGGVDAEVKFVGPQGDFSGLDQVNILVPRSLAGRGEADLLMTVDGQQANVVRVNIK